MWWFIALWIISAVAVYFLMPKPETAKPPEVQEVDIASVEDGKTIPILFGTRNTESFNVVWWGDVQTRSWEDDLVIGYYYFVGVHAVLFHGPIDDIHAIISDDKLAWSGICEGCEIHLPKTSADLYGGKLEGGGFGGMAYGGDGLGDFDGSGYIDIDMGYPDQPRNWYLEHNLDGGDAVGDTGAHEIPAFRGVVGAILKRVYIGTSPNLRKLSFRGQRVHVRQDGIGQWYDEKVAIPVSCVVSGLEEGVAWRLVIFKANTELDYDPDYVSDNCMVLELEFIDDAGSRIPALDQDVDGIDWPTNSFEDKAIASPDGGAYPSTKAVDGDFNPESHWATGLRPTYENPQYIGIELGSSRNLKIVKFNLTPMAAGLPYLSFHAPEDFALEYRTIDGDWVRVQSWIGELFRTASGEYITRSFVVDDYIPPDDPSIIAPRTTPYWDMNPAHIIRECLTDPDWGNGSGELSPDEDAFQYAADTLFNEVMGISIKWVAQTSIDDFIDLIKKHINAELYPDHSTGKNILKLIRDDYSPDNLIILGEGDIVKVDNANRPLIGELINSVTVQYWDTCIDRDASVTVVDQALVQMQGATINTTIQYPGFTNKRIATLVATRDLRVLSSQLLSCTLYVKRTAEVLNLGDVFIMRWPKLEIDGIIMRVQGINFGSGRQNTIKLDVVEDVFGLPATVVVGDNENDPSWTSPIQLPVPVDYQVSVETPYYDLIQLLGQVNLTARLSSNSVLGYVSSGATRPENAINAIMATDNGSGYTDVGTLQFAGSITLLEDVDQIETVWNYDTAIDLGVLVIGSHAEIDAELVRIDVIDSDSETITVARGVLDTSPRKHLARAKLLGWGSRRGFGPNEYSTTDTVNVKLKPVTGKGVLDIVDATAYPVTMGSRALRPYPPANLQADGVAYPETIIIISSAITITWAHRDRLTQGITPHTDGSTGPEAGTTYDLTVEDDAQAIQITHSNLTGVSQDIDISAFTNGDYTLKISSKRDSIVSWDHIKWDFLVSLVPVFDGTIATMELIVDSPFSYDASTHYTDGNAVTSYLLQNAPSGMVIDNSGEITWTPTSESTTNGVTVTGTNSSGSAVSNTFNVIVSEAAGSRSNWRIYITAVQGSGGVEQPQIAEIEMMSSIGGSDQCSGGTVTASSYYFNSALYAPPRAFDDLTNTTWMAGDDLIVGEWIAYEFTAPVEVAKISIQSSTPSNAPTDFELQYHNGSDWITVLTVADETGWTTLEIREFAV